MSGFLKALKNQIKEEVVRMAQPQPQQQNGAPQYQYQQQQQQPGSYGPSLGQYGQQHAPPPPPVTYQQYHQGSVSQPSYQSNPQPTYPPPPPREGPSYGAQPTIQPDPPVPVNPRFGGNILPAPPPAPFQNPALQPNACTARKNVLTKHNQFYVFKHSVFPRQDPNEQDLAFAICEGCYNTHVSRVPGIASSFEPFNSPDSTAAGAVAIPTSRALCDFWLPVVKDTFYKQCIPQNSIGPLVNVAHEVQKLSPCPGNLVWQGGEIYTSPSLPNCSTCSGCYELYLKPAFGSYFKKELRDATAKWTCDIGKDPGYVHDLLTSNLNSASPNFATFARGLNERLNLAPCAGENEAVQPNQGSKVLMYCIPNLDLGACPECYYDYLKLTPFSHFFVPKSYDPGTVACDLASPTSRFLLTKALATNNLSAWQSGLENFNKIPKCTYMSGTPEEDVQRQQNELGQLATWYSVIHCPRRFVLRPEGLPTTLHWRGYMLRTVLDGLSETPPFTPAQNRDFSIFLSLTAILNSTGPPCGAAVRGFKKPSGRRYFGRVAVNTNSTNDCTVVMCEECYNDLVKDGPLENWLGSDLTDEVYRGDSVPWKKEGFCQPWSKTSKAVLRKAAEAGDFTIFARHWNHRTIVRAQTLPQIALLRQQYQLQNQAKLSSQLNATMVQGGASFAEAAGTTGYNYGNSVVGMGYNSYAGVDAAMWKRKADQTPWGDTGIFVQIAELERQFKAVE